MKDSLQNRKLYVFYRGGRKGFRGVRKAYTTNLLFNRIYLTNTSAWFMLGISIRNESSHTLRLKKRTAKVCIF